jgi:hypothetical protein
MKTYSSRSRSSLYFIMAATLALVLAESGCKEKSQPSATPAPPAATPSAARTAPVGKTSFEAVTSSLDPGGTLYVYVGTAQWLEGLSGKLTGLRDDLLGNAGLPVDQAETFRRGFDLGLKLFQQSGLESLDGVGVSGIAIGDGLYQTKIVAHRSAKAPPSGIWTLFGQQPVPLKALDLLPANTAWASFGTVDAASLWNTLSTEIGNSGIPTLQNGINQLDKMLESATGMKPDQLLGSLGGEVGAVLTLNDEQLIPIPAGPGQPVQIPEPRLALVLSVKDDRLFDWLDGKLKDNPQVVRSDENGLRVRVLPVPAPLPVQIRASVARYEDKLILATHDELIRAMVAIKAGGKPGLRSSDEFVRLAKGMPETGNSFAFVSRRFGKALQQVQMAMFFANAGAADGSGPARLFAKLSALNQDVEAYSVARSSSEGWVTTLHGTQEPATAVLVPLVVAPVAVMAGMTLPALAQAKSKAQSISCVNNLKQLGLAARIYANDHNDQPPPHLASLQEELGSNKILVCPADQARLNQPLPDWKNLTDDSSSYEYLGKDFGQLPGSDPSRVLFRCRIHGHACLADGSVQMKQGN